MITDASHLGEESGVTYLGRFPSITCFSECEKRHTHAAVFQLALPGPGPADYQIPASAREPEPAPYR